MRIFVATLVFSGMMIACGSDYDPKVTYTPEAGNSLDRAEIFNQYNRISLQNFEYEELFARLNYTSNLQPVIDSTERPIIAVLDSGYFLDKPGFQNRIWQAPAGIDTKCGGSIGCNTSGFKMGDSLFGDSDILPETSKTGFCEDGRADCFHGTSVASLIAGYDPDAEALGICPICQIIPIKVTDSSETISDSAIFGALLYISNLKAQGVPVRIVNASFGKYLSSERVALGLRSLPHMDDVLIAAAAGNENSTEQSYPAAWDQIISVASVSYFDSTKSPFSNYGNWVDIAAPSGFLDYIGLTAFPLELNGTSFSAPLVAGAAGLILAAEPQLSIRELKARIVGSADAAELYQANPDYLFNYNGAKVTLLGSGLLNIGKALAADTSGSVASGDRVQAGCASIGGASTSTLPQLSLLLLLALPALLKRLRNAQN